MQAVICVKSGYYQSHLLCVCVRACMHACVCDREELQERYGGKLTRNMSGALYEVFSKIMRALVGKKITVPGPFKRFFPI